MHGLGNWRGEYHLLIDVMRKLIRGRDSSAIIYGYSLFSAAHPSTLRINTSVEDVGVPEAIDAAFP